MVEQFASFREGFFEMVPKDLVGVFDERELEVNPKFNKLTYSFLSEVYPILTLKTGEKTLTTADTLKQTK